MTTAKDFWVPSVNNYGATNYQTFGRWSYIEIADPWEAASVIRGHIANDPFAHWFPPRQKES